MKIIVTPLFAATLSALRQQLAEKENQRQNWMEQCRRQGQNAQVEIDRLKKQLAEMRESYDIQATEMKEAWARNAGLLEQLAASQLREQQLREALKTAGMNCVDDFIAAGALQLADSKSDTSALEALIAKAGEVMRARCDKVLEDMREEYGDEEVSAAWVFRAIHNLSGVTLEDLQK